MYRPYLIVWLLVAGAAPGSDCRLTTGPDGLCAAIRLEPRHAELSVRNTLWIKTTGLDCTRDFECVDCTHRRRVRWRSSAPDVAVVDSTGLVRAEHTGVADIRLESDESAPRVLGSVRVVISR